MAYTINELNGSGKSVVLTEGNGRDDAANYVAKNLDKIREKEA